MKMQQHYKSLNSLAVNIDPFGFSLNVFFSPASQSSSHLWLSIQTLAFQVAEVNQLKRYTLYL